MVSNVAPQAECCSPVRQGKARHGVLALALVLAGCGQAPLPPAPAASDPAMAGALEAPLLVDPDLAQRNPRNLAIVPPSPKP